MPTQAPSSHHPGGDPQHGDGAGPIEFSGSAPRLRAVSAKLAYLSPMAERPYSYMCNPPPGVPRQNCEYRLREVEIADARLIASPPNIDVEGFELWDAPTSLKSFEDEEAIRSRYYEEAAELAKYATGGKLAYVFDHQLRRREARRPILSFGREGGGNRPGAAGRIHNDYTEGSGQKRFALMNLDPDVRSQVQRFAIVNIWRSIGGKVVDTPLAVCDGRTISVADLVVGDIHYLDRSGEIYLVQHSQHHRWAYFSEMDRHEALVFKQYDSRVNGVARFTPHSAFDLPDVPPEAPLRESIEIRCLVTYD